MAYGDGTKPRQRKDGKWIATVEAGWTERGTRRRRSVIGKTEAEAKRKLRDLKREMAAGETRAVSRSTTLKRWADEWLPMQASRTRPNSWAATETIVRRWIVPTIGNRRLHELGARDVRAVEDAQRRAGLAPTSMTRTRAVLMRMLKDARTEGHSIPEPVFSVPAVRRGENGRREISAPDCIQLLAAASDKASWPQPADGDRAAGKRYRLARQHHVTRWAVAMMAGLRQGEALGLTWDRVDLERGVMRIDRQLQSLPARAVEHEVGAGWYDAQPLEGRYALVPVKSAAGGRMIPLVPWLRDQLERWRDECPESPYGLVWPRESGGPWSAGDDRIAFQGLQDAAGVHKGGEAGGWEYYVPHEMRHSAATLLRALKAPPAVIIAIMGHASIASTAAYEHADLEQAQTALSGVAGLLQLEN